MNSSQCRTGFYSTYSKVASKVISSLKPTYWSVLGTYLSYVNVCELLVFLVFTTSTIGRCEWVHAACILRAPWVVVKGWKCTTQSTKQWTIFITLPLEVHGSAALCFTSQCLPVSDGPDWCMNILWRFCQICSGPVVGEMSPQNQHVQLFFSQIWWSDSTKPPAAAAGARQLKWSFGATSGVSFPPLTRLYTCDKMARRPAAQTGLNRALRLDINFCSSAPLSFLAPISSAYLSPLSAEPPGRPGQTLPLMCSK